MRKIAVSACDYRIRERHERSESLTDLAHAYRLSLGQVRMALKRAGYRSQFPRFTRDQKRIVRRLFRQRASFTKIGSAIGVSRHSAYNLCVKMGLWQRQPWTDVQSQLARVRRRVEKREPLRTIARDIGISRGTLLKTLHDTDWYVRHDIEHALTHEESARACSMTKQGFFLREIAQELGVRDYALVKKAARRDGWLHVLYPTPSHKSGQHKLLLRRLRESGRTLRDWYSYLTLVRKLSADAYRRYAHVIDPHGLRGRDWHVDHRLSVAEACMTWIDPRVISHPANLCMLRARDNRRKNLRSSVTLRELRREIAIFERRHGRYRPLSTLYQHEWKEAA